MRPLILLAALLWLQGFLAEVRWAWGKGLGWVGLFSGACLGFPPLYGAPQLVFIREEGNGSLPSQASTGAGRTDRSSLPDCRLLPASCAVLSGNVSSVVCGSQCVGVRHTGNLLSGLDPQFTGFPRGLCSRGLYTSASPIPLLPTGRCMLILGREPRQAGWR